MNEIIIVKLLLLLVTAILVGRICWRARKEN